MKSSSFEQHPLQGASVDASVPLNDLSYGEAEPANSTSSFSLVTLFNVTTACGLFFAVMRFSPLLAIALTVIMAPAIIRTGLIQDISRRNNRRLSWAERVQFFCSSIGVVLLTLAFAGSIFVMTSVLFGLLGMAFSAIVGNGELNIDAAVVGTAGGMIWGMAAAILATGYVGIKLWLPKSLLDVIGD